MNVRCGMGRGDVFVGRAGESEVERGRPDGEGSVSQQVKERKRGKDQEDRCRCVMLKLERGISPRIPNESVYSPTSAWIEVCARTGQVIFEKWGKM